MSAAIEGLMVDVSDPNNLRAELAPMPISLKTPRMGHTCTSLPNGTVMVLGGMSSSEGKIERTGEVINF